MSKELRRIGNAEALRLLGISRRNLSRMIDRDVFSTQKDGEAKTCKQYFFLDEIETYIEANAGSDGEAGERAVLALRVQKRRKRK